LRKQYEFGLLPLWRLFVYECQACIGMPMHDRMVDAMGTVLLSLCCTREGLVNQQGLREKASMRETSFETTRAWCWASVLVNECQLQVCASNRERVLALAMIRRPNVSTTKCTCRHLQIDHVVYLRARIDFPSRISQNRYKAQPGCGIRFMRCDISVDYGLKPNASLAYICTSTSLAGLSALLEVVELTNMSASRGIASFRRLARIHSH
jgi:hypothetical protein